MTDRTIFITQYDMDRLRDLIEGASLYGTKTRNALEALEKALDKAVILEPENIPENVVTMHSNVHLTKLDTKEEFVYELVFPSEANIKLNKISILAPIGIALIGREVGSVIEWNISSGRAKFKIEKIMFQPEAAGQFHL